MRCLAIFVLLLCGCSEGDGDNDNNYPKELRSTSFLEFVGVELPNWGNPDTKELNCLEGAIQGSSNNEFWCELDGIRHGYSVSFYGNGNLLRLREYAHGKLVGTIYEYYDNGQIRYKDETQGLYTPGYYLEWWQNSNLKQAFKLSENDDPEFEPPPHYESPIEFQADWYESGTLKFFLKFDQFDMICGEPICLDEQEILIDCGQLVGDSYQFYCRDGCPPCEE